MAEEHGLDLVEISPTADPPVCRIMDYGKFLYNKAKKERKARTSSRTEVKELRL
jgi:translation initiation factor IF-3